MVNVLPELTQPSVFLTVIVPVYVPAAVLAGTVILIGLEGNEESVMAAKLFAGEAFQEIE